MSESIILPKKRTSDTAAPGLSSLYDGELAINVPAKKIYIRVGNVIHEIANAGSYDAGVITSGQFANARISQSSVTQHQGALSINYNQLTNTPQTFLRASVGDKSGPSSNSINDGSDLNDWTGSFFGYANSTILNRPPMGNANVLGWGLSSYTTQIGARNSRIAFRTQESGSWSDWFELLHSGNFNPGTKYDYSAADDAGLVQWRTATDLNVRQGTGSGVKFFRAINTTANTPISNSYFSVMQMTYDATGGAQLALSVVAERAWIRRSPNASWAELLTTSNFNTDIYATLSGSNFNGLRVSGAPPEPTGQGMYLGWNHPSGSGSGVFLNHRGSGGGGFIWSDTSTDRTSATELMRLSGNGNLSAAALTVTNGVLANNGGSVFLRPNGLGSTVGQAQLTTGGNLSVPGSLSSSSLDIVGGNGNGIRFWGGNSLYSIYMAQSENAEGGRIGETTSDYNMYFKMGSGTNRGFVFLNGSSPHTRIGPDGIYTQSNVTAGVAFANSFRAASGTGDLCSSGAGSSIRLMPNGFSTSNMTSIASNGNMSVSGTVSDNKGNVRKIHTTISSASSASFTSDFINGSVEKNASGNVTWTILPNIGSNGDVITVVNSSTSGNITIARGSGVALYRNGTNANIVLGPGSTLSMYLSATANRWIA